ncbi:MAG: ribose-5-phosphate isomerase RpiA [Ardenticatenaceae bacterium]|nr:ribose-5-phosphate isomerase RpiA [Ardenticatenaceae bacterium]MCB9443232.1 ribose-5-phosphate isomerase RpiA [Ardenticatenaceae bacterium]
MANSIDDLKRQAAEKAVEFVKSGMVVGLGTGSTAVHAVNAVGQMLQDGRLHDIVAIPTSESTARNAQKWGIPLTTFDDHPVIDVTIDGADEVTPDLDVMKGLGGALLREKIVAIVSKQLIIVADDSKHVTRLATKAPIPIEVIPFARQPVITFLELLGGRPVWRQKDGQPYITDEKNIIIDCFFDGGLADPAAMAQVLINRPGIVEHGLFLGLTAMAIFAGRDGVEIVTR